MKVVILAGGLGTRISEETDRKPKPMVTVGGQPLLWHILKSFSAYGCNEFIICCGYKGYVIKEYFANYFLHMSDVTFDMSTNQMEVHQNHAEPWKVTLVDTGDETQTGGRLKRIAPHLQGDELFCLTYGDGVSDVNISELLAFHREQGRLATVTATKPPGRFGAINHEQGLVTSFQEKPQGDGSYINAGFFVLSPDVLELIEGDDTCWEKEPLERLAADGQLSAFVHEGFWQCMDTLRDRNLLDKLWLENRAPWKIW
jgi:glucose-1-phosphate cytidylyltransferase